MPVFKNLSIARANHILSLADRSFEALPDREPRVIGAGELLDRMREPERPERRALLDELDTLTQREALDLVAIMYVGRGDYIEDSQDGQQVLDAFNAQLRDFAGDDVDSLIEACAGKDLAFHRYLRRGLALLS